MNSIKITLAILLILMLLASSFQVTFESSNPSNAANVYQIGMFYNPASSNNITKDLYIMKNAGIEWLRFNFAWNVIEPNEGMYNFSLYDLFINKALSLGFKLVGILGQGSNNLLPSWLQSIGGVNNSYYLSFLSSYAKAVVERYGNKISIWQIENELNHIYFYLLVGFRSGNWNFNIAKQILITLSSIVRNYSSSSIMINVIVNNPNWQLFLENLTNWNVSYDIIGIDYYPTYLDDYSSNAGSPIKGLQIYNYINQAKKFGKEIMVAETGYSDYNSLHTQSKQAEYVRKVIEGSLLAGVNTIMFYQFSDPSSCVAKGNNIDAVEGHFGFIDCNGNAKAAWNELVNSINYHFNLIIEGFSGSSRLNLTIYVDGLKLSTPINVTLPSGLISVYVPNQTLDNVKYVFQSTILNNQTINYNNFTISLNKNTYLKIYYNAYYPFKLNLYVKNIGYINLTFSILANNSKITLINGFTYLKTGSYLITLPSNLTIYGLQVVPANNNFTILINKPITLNITLYPIYNLTIIVLDWLGNYANSGISVNNTSYYSSLLNLRLNEGNYTVKVSSIIGSQNIQVNLNGNQYIIFYVPNMLIFVLILISFIVLILIALIYTFIKRKVTIKEQKFYRPILSSIYYVIFLIIIPYFIPSYVFKTLLNQNLQIWDLNELLIFGLPVALASILSLIKKARIPWPILTAFFLNLYMYFVIGRAFSGQFGIYEFNILGVIFSINLAIYIAILMALITIRGIANYILSFK